MTDADRLPAGKQPVCPRCGTEASGSTWCSSCGLNLSSQQPLPSADAYSAKVREKRWLEEHDTGPRDGAEGLADERQANSGKARSKARLAMLFGAVAVAALGAGAAVFLVMDKGGTSKEGESAVDTSLTVEVARVGSRVITRDTFDHWYRIVYRTERSQDGARVGDPPPALRSREGRQLKKQVMEFLITGDWILGEARDRGITANKGEVDRDFENTKNDSFDSDADYRRFLRRSGQMQDDVLFRVRLELLSKKIRRHVQRASSESGQQTLDAFQEEFKSKWKARTMCAPRFRVADCGAILGRTGGGDNPADVGGLRKCGALDGDLANNVFDIQARKLDCGTAKRLATQYVMNGHDPEGFTCDDKPTGYEQGIVECANDAGDELIRFSTGA